MTVPLWGPSPCPGLSPPSDHLVPWEVWLLPFTLGLLRGQGGGGLPWPRCGMRPDRPRGVVQKTWQSMGL